MSEEHWSSTFEHESLAEPEARESFTKAMGKYDSQEAAVFGGYEAQKLAGKPFKLPESLDKLDENIRGEFTSNAQKLLGIEPVTEDGLNEINFTEGLPEGAEADETTVAALKQFATENGWNKAQIQQGVSFWNNAMAQAVQNQTNQQAEAAKTTNEALIKHFGSEEKVTEQSELVKRWFKDQSGLSAQEYEAVGEELANSVFTKNPILSRVFMEHFGPLASEGSTETGKGGKDNKPVSLEKQTIEESPNTAKALGWDT